MNIRQSGVIKIIRTVLFFWIISFLALSTLSASEEIIKDGGFDAGISHWNDTGSRMNYTYDKTEGHKAPGCLKAVCGDPSGWNFIVYDAGSTLKCDVKYKLSWWAKSEDVSSAFALDTWIPIDWERKIDWCQVINPEISNKWQNYLVEVVFYSYQTGKNEIKPGKIRLIPVSIKKGQAVYIDDISLQESR